MDRIEGEAESHRRDDAGQFQTIRDEMANGFKFLGERIDKMGGQINTLTLDKERAEGRAEGIASVAAANAQPKWWMGWISWGARAALIGVVTLVSGLVVALWKDQQQLATLQAQARPATQVTVQPAVPVQPIPGQPAPPVSLPPSQLSDDPPNP